MNDSLIIITLNGVGHERLFSNNCKIHSNHFSYLYLAEIYSPDDITTHRHDPDFYYKGYFMGCNNRCSLFSGEFHISISQK